MSDDCLHHWPRHNPSREIDFALADARPALDQGGLHPLLHVTFSTEIVHYVTVAAHNNRDVRNRVAAQLFRPWHALTIRALNLWKRPCQGATRLRRWTHAEKAVPLTFEEKLAHLRVFCAQSAE